MARIQEKYIIDGLNKFRRFMGLKPIIVFQRKYDLNSF